MPASSLPRMCTAALPLPRTQALSLLFSSENDNTSSEGSEKRLAFESGKRFGYDVADLIALVRQLRFPDVMFPVAVFCKGIAGKAPEHEVKIMVRSGRQGAWIGGSTLTFLFDGDAGAGLTVALAHGAGAPMDSPFMAFFAEGLARRGWRVARFEFPYMEARRGGVSREENRRRPPDRLPVLIETWRAAIAAFERERAGGRLVIGGKSLGGRIASMIANEAGVRGLLCLGYPFQPPGKRGTGQKGPAKTEGGRVAHLKSLRTPALIVQGTRDPFGGPEEVGAYDLSPAITVHWIEDGDHSFVPRKRSGRTQQQNEDEALAAVAGFLAGRCGAA